MRISGKVKVIGAAVGAVLLVILIIAVSASGSAPAAKPAAAPAPTCDAACQSAANPNPAPAAKPKPAKPKPAVDPNVAALKIVQKFDAQANPSPPNGDWEAFTAPLETASGMATDQTLSTDILDYHNDLVWNGTDAYEGGASNTLTAIAQSYGVNIWPNG